MKKMFLAYDNLAYDDMNGKIINNPTMKKFFQELGKENFKSHYKYKNLDKLYDFCIDKILRKTKFNYSYLPKFTLNLEDDSYVRFEISGGGNYPFLSLNFNIKKNKDKNGYEGRCVSFTWYPFLKLIYLGNLLYSDKKIIPNEECQVKNIPEKSGTFFLNLLEDISKRFGVKINYLEDASKYYVSKKIVINLSFYSLHKNGKTYYGKFGFQPTKDNHDKIQWKTLLNIPFESAQDELDYITTKLKKTKPTKKAEWFKTINELNKIFPDIYYRKIK